MSSKPVWTWHDKYKRNYKEFTSDGKHWRQYDNDNGPLVEVRPVGIPNPSQSISQSQTIHRDPTIPRSQPVAAGLSASPQSGTSETQPYTAGESRYFTSNSPTNTANAYHLPPIQDSWGANRPEEASRNPWGANQPEEATTEPWGADQPEEANREPRGPSMPMSMSSGYFSSRTDQFSSTAPPSTAYIEFSDIRAQVSSGEMRQTARRSSSQAPLPLGQGYVSHSPAPYLPSHSEITPLQEDSTPQQTLQSSERPVGDTGSNLASRHSGGQNKKYPDQHGRISIPAKSGTRRRLSSSVKPQEEQKMESTAALVRKMSLSDNASVSEKALDEPSPPSQRSVNETPLPPHTEDEVRDNRYYIRSSADEGNEEQLDHRYKRRTDPGRFFKEGRVFALLWSEPHGDNGMPRGDNGTDVSVRGYKTKHGEKVYTGIRRMVVVKEKKGCSWCIPVLTYGERGTSKPGIDPSSHAIIYMSNSKPARLQSETGIIKEPICVDPSTPDQKLSQLSRVNFAKVYTVEHNVKVLPVGSVAKKSMHHLRGYFKIEFEK